MKDATLALSAPELPLGTVEHLGRCPVCGDEARRLVHQGLQDALFGSAGYWDMYECAGCGAGYLDPRLSRDAIGMAYRNYYTHDERTDDDPLLRASGFGTELKRKIALQYVRRKFGPTGSLSRNPLAAVMLLKPALCISFDASMRHLPRVRPGQSLLDIGCGNGRFMAWARSVGWDCEGTEVDPLAAEHARARGFVVHLGDAADLAQRGRRFDAVTLSHVIEHVHAPRELLRAARDLLVPGGLLWIETPNFRSLGHRRFGEHWRGLEPPRHLQLFHPQLLRALLGEAGFGATKVAPWQLDWQAMAAASQQLQREAGVLQTPPADGEAVGRADSLRREFVSLMARAAPKPKRVLAAVVTFNPDETLLPHLASLRSQCEEVLVVDNASANGDWVESICRRAGCTLVRNDRNLGISGALNQAAAIAQQGDFGWLATFDQDSSCPDGAIPRVLDHIETHPRRDEAAIVAMAHVDRGTGRDYHHSWDIIDETPRWRILRATITSGSMVRADVFASVSLFDEMLFIDSVDHDFCMRLRKAGWIVLEDRLEQIDHSIGRATEHRLLGRRFVCTHHSPLRRYYMTRNQLEVAARYLTFDPRWAIKGMMQATIGATVALLYERDKGRKLLAVIRGVCDFMLRRFGPAH